MDSSTIIRKQLLFALRGGNAHIPIKRGIQNFPKEVINQKIENMTHTPWQLLEHIRIAQNDILEFIKDPNYTSPDWPKEYWPKSDDLGTEEKWDNSVKEFFFGLDEIESYVKNNEVDLFAPIPHSTNYTIFREVLVLADHNSYHLGQLMMMQKMLS